MRSALPREFRRVESTHVAHVSSTVGLCVRIDDLAIEPRARDTEPVPMPHHRRRVHCEDDNIAAARPTHERNYTVIGIVEIDPLKTFVGIVTLPKRWLSLVNIIEMLHQPPHAVMTRPA